MCVKKMWHGGSIVNYVPGGCGSPRIGPRDSRPRCPSPRSPRRSSRGRGPARGETWEGEGRLARLYVYIDGWVWIGIQEPACVYQRVGGMCLVFMNTRSCVTSLDPDLPVQVLGHLENGRREVAPVGIGEGDGCVCVNMHAHVRIMLLWNDNELIRWRPWAYHLHLPLH